MAGRSLAVFFNIFILILLLFLFFFFLFFNSESLVAVASTYLKPLHRGSKTYSIWFCIFWRWGIALIPPPPHTHTERGFSTLARVGKKKFRLKEGLKLKKESPHSMLGRKLNLTNIFSFLIRERDHHASLVQWSLHKYKCL